MPNLGRFKLNMTCVLWAGLIYRSKLKCWNMLEPQNRSTWFNMITCSKWSLSITHPNPFVVVSSCFISLLKLSHLLHICVEFSNGLPQLSLPERLRYIAVHRGTSPLTEASWCGANTYCRAAVARPGRRRPAATPRHPKSLDLGWKPAFLGVRSCEESKAFRREKQQAVNDNYHLVI